MYILVLLHFLSDWLLQPRKIATRKSSNDLWLGLHVLIIFGVFATYCLIAGLSVWLAVINAMLHGIIDRTIWRGYEKVRFGKYTKEDLKQFKPYKDDWFWKIIGFDQALHYAILIYLFI